MWINLFLVAALIIQPTVTFAENWMDKADVIEKLQGRAERDRVLQQCEARMLSNRARDMEDCFNQIEIGGRLLLKQNQ
jgi:hypothetical protein